MRRLVAKLYGGVYLSVFNGVETRSPHSTTDLGLQGVIFFLVFFFALAFLI